MTRVKRGVTARARHKKVLAQTAGHSGSRHRLFKTANESLMHALAYQYRDRRNRKRDMRRLWITRINAGVRGHGLSYSRFIAALAAQGMEINRKMLADLAVNDPAAFGALVEAAQAPA
jgi:large subunit ribosomal protein L20